MSPGSPFPLSVNLNATHEDATLTTDTNVFPPEINKIVTKGMRKEKFWIKCDGKDHMDFKHITYTLKSIERLGNLKDKGRVTDEQFEDARKVLLDRI